MIIWLASYPKSGNTMLRSMLSAYFFTEDGRFDFYLLKNIIQFPNINLFRNAFVHKSYCCMKNTNFTDSNISCPEDCLPLQVTSYETNEFLGDAILGSIVTSYIYDRFHLIHKTLFSLVLRITMQ